MNKQEYLLTVLSEECAEVAQRVSKALRFGLDAVEPGQELTNEERIVREYLDLVAVVEMCVSNAILFEDIDAEYIVAAKKKKVKVFMELSKSRGTLTE